MPTCLQSPLFNKIDISTLFSLRSRTVRGIRNDFKEMYKPNLSCPLCGNHIDSLPDLLSCSKLKTEIKAQPESIKRSVNQTRYEDIFSGDLTKQKRATDTYILLMILREKLLDTLALAPPAALAPVLLAPCTIPAPWT